jgi:hypothetical protein
MVNVPERGELEVVSRQCKDELPLGFERECLCALLLDEASKVTTNGQRTMSLSIQLSSAPQVERAREGL